MNEVTALRLALIACFIALASVGLESACSPEDPVVVVTACDPSLPAEHQAEALVERMRAGASMTDCDVDLVIDLAMVATACVDQRSDWDFGCWDDLNACETGCRVRWDEPTIYGDIIERLDDCQRATAEDRPRPG